MKYLFIGAHADDIEIGCGGTILKLYKKNKITNYIATDSEYYDENGKIIRSSKDAFNDISRAYKNKKISNIFGKLKVHYLFNNEELRRELIKINNNIKPEIVFIPWKYDPHPDHQNLSNACQVVFRNVKNLIMYRSNSYFTKESFNKNFFIDISKSFYSKIKLIKSFKSEMKRTNYSWIKEIQNDNVQNGYQIKKKYAEAFEIIKISNLI